MNIAAKAHLDFETKSPVNLKTSGLSVYALDPGTDIWLFSWSLGGDQVWRWRPNDPDPEYLLWHIANGGIVTAHHAAFERWIWNNVLRGTYRPHWPELKIEQQDCTMSRAAAMTLPLDLDNLSVVLGQKQQKDNAGHAVMMKLCKPRKVLADGTPVWWDDPLDIIRQEAYCDQDVRTETETDTLLPALSPYERKVWEFDQVINDRGVMFDINMCVRAGEMVDLAKRKADAKCKKLTDGMAPKITQTGKLAEWINSRGIPTVTFTKDDHDDILELAAETNDEAVKAVVELRRAANKTSTAKYKRILQTACPDNRVRQLFSYHVASTGRWGGRLVQVQNLPRVDEETEQPFVNHVVALLNSRTTPISLAYDMIAMACGEPMFWLSKALRSTIIAPPGRKLVSGDFSNIEGRVNAWLAGERWKLEAFRAYDAKTGPDLYKMAYAKSFGGDVALVKKPQRQVGKVQELACGYQGGVGAILRMGGDPVKLIEPVRAALSPAEWQDRVNQYEHAQDKFDLAPDTWAAVKTVVVNWRAAHPAIYQSWRDLQDAAIEAVAEPGVIVPVYDGKCSYVCDGGWLFCQLPSGRVISYASPFLKEIERTYINKDGEEYTKTQLTVMFYGWNGQYRRWGVEALYGGIQCENIVQAVARDVLVDRMFAVEEAGYPVIMHVHDEIVSEVDAGFGSAEEYGAIMSVKREWMTDLPLAAAAWEDVRYVK